MWLITRYGFYSTAVYRPGHVTVRARCFRHLQNLKNRFPGITSPIVKSDKRDYPYRMTVPVNLWAGAVQNLVMEQDYSNFKAEAAKAAEGQLEGHDYIDALHAIWSIMRRFQRKQEGLFAKELEQLFFKGKPFKE